MAPARRSGVRGRPGDPSGRSSRSGQSGRTSRTTGASRTNRAGRGTGVSGASGIGRTDASGRTSRGTARYGRSGRSGYSSRTSTAARGSRTSRPGVRRSSHPGGHTPRGPAQRRRTTTNRAARSPHRRPPGGLTGRAAVLGLVVCALVVSLAYPLKQYIAERGTVATLQAERQQVQNRVDALEQRRAQLDDPNYIRGQARERLQYVMPGDTTFNVIFPKPQPKASSRPAPTDGLKLDPDQPWYSQLWRTVRAADGG